MAWRDLAIVGVVKKFLGQKTETAHVVVKKVRVEKTTVVPDEKTGALVVQKAYHVATTVEGPEEIVPKAKKTAAEQTEQKASTPEAKPVADEKVKAVTETEPSAEKTASAKVVKEEAVEAPKAKKAKTVKESTEKETEKAKKTVEKRQKSAETQSDVKASSEVKEAQQATKQEKTSTSAKQSEEKPVSKKRSEKEEKASKEAQKSVKAAKKEQKQEEPTEKKKDETKAKVKKSAAKAPSKRDQKLKLYREDIKKHLGEVDEEFLKIVVKNLGPSIYNKDAESVACSDPKELETVKNNFLVRKLGLPKEDPERLDKEVAKVCEKLKGVKTKYRATFYYMLAKNLGLESKLS